MQPSKPPRCFEDQVQHFRSIPSFSEHLLSPNIVITPLSRRSGKPRDEDALFAETLNTPDTISDFVVSYTKPDSPHSLIPEVKSFMTLGNKVDGLSGVCHGGVVATILDETMSLGMTENTHGSYFMTAYLNTTYMRPVKTPGTVLVTSRLKRVEGKKIFVEAVMEDENGQKLAKADALFLESRAML